MGGSYDAPNPAERPRRSLYGLYINDARHLDSDPSTENGLVETHLFYVVQVAREFRSLGIPFEDLLAEGNLGLIEAAARFDRERGVKFISYAAWWIRKRMHNLISRQINLVRIPKYRMERLRRLRQAERDLRAVLRRPPTAEEIAERSGLSESEASLLRTQSQREISLDAVLDIDTGLRLEDTLSEAAPLEPADAIAQEDSEALLLRLLQRIPERQREILSMHFGLGARRPATLAEIGRRLGISRERVRQLEQQGLLRLRRLMEPRDQTRAS